MPMRSQLVLRIFDDFESLNEKLADAIASLSKTTKSGLSLALTGGKTVGRVYKTLRANHRDAGWERVDFFWSDERLVPIEHLESNVRQAKDLWLSSLKVPCKRIHVPNGEAMEPQRAAEAYEGTLRQYLGPDLSLGCALLSLGEDGHIASLFPGHPATLETTRLVVPVLDSPKPPIRRITMTLAMLNRAAVVYLVAVGAEKAAALRDTLEGSLNLMRCPAQGLQFGNSKIVVWADQNAAAQLSKSETC